jgi:hypothetical protein
VRDIQHRPATDEQTAVSTSQVHQHACIFAVNPLFRRRSRLSLVDTATQRKEWHSSPRCAIYPYHFTNRSWHARAEPRALRPILHTTHLDPARKSNPHITRAHESLHTVRDRDRSLGSGARFHRPSLQRLDRCTGEDYFPTNSLLSNFNIDMIMQTTAMFRTTRGTSRCVVLKYSQAVWIMQARASPGSASA